MSSIGSINTYLRIIPLEPSKISLVMVHSRGPSSSMLISSAKKCCCYGLAIYLAAGNTRVIAKKHIFFLSQFKHQYLTLATKQGIGFRHNCTFRLKHHSLAKAYCTLQYNVTWPLAVLLHTNRYAGILSQQGGCAHQDIWGCQIIQLISIPLNLEVLNKHNGKAWRMLIHHLND